MAGNGIGNGNGNGSGFGNVSGNSNGFGNGNVSGNGNNLIGFSDHRLGWVSEDSLRRLKMKNRAENGDGVQEAEGAVDAESSEVPDIDCAAKSSGAVDDGAGTDTAARARLLAEAQSLLPARPYTVMDKKTLPPSHDKRDYMSLSIYHWPNPDTADGKPYVTRDGQVNPEVEDYDRPSLARMVYAVETLLLAYAVTDKSEYAAKAIELLDAWFIRPDTRMNPNMLYAQYIPGDGGFDRPARYPAVYVPGVPGEGIYVAFGGVIEGVRLVPLVNVLPLLDDCPLWREEQRHAVREWFRQFLFWLLDHQHGKDEAGCLNNHGSWYCVQIAAYALFAGEEEIARHILDKRVPDRIALQIMPDGSQPEELGRANAFHYVVYSLLSFFNAATLAERLGIDLWNREADGSSIRSAMEWLVPYVQDPSSWPYPTNKPIAEQLVGAVPLLYMADKAYGEPIYRQLLERLTPYGRDHRFRLLFADPLP